MKLLFVHGEEKVKEDTLGNFYTDGSYNKEVWDRYLSLFGSMSVVFRKDPMIYDPSEAKLRLQFFDKEKIDLILIPDLKASLKEFLSVKGRQAIDAAIEQAVRQHDCLIARLPCEVGSLAVHYAVKYNKPYLIEAVGCPFDALWNHSIKGKVLAAPSKLRMQRSVKDADRVVYVTEKFLQDRYPSKGRTLACSDVSLPFVDENLIGQRIKRITERPWDKPLVIGTVGAVNIRFKGQQDVIRALSVLKKEGIDLKYHLVGGGDDSYLRALAEELDVADRICFLGIISHEKVFEFLDEIDLYIQPSKHEGLPRALIEAMSRGCPALGSKAGGIPELLSPRCTFDAGNIRQICDLLKSADRQMMIREAKNNIDKAKEFEKETLNRKRMEYYKQFAESASALLTE